MSQVFPELERELPVDDHPAGLYSSSRVAETVPRLSSIGEKEIDFFLENGYLAGERCFSLEAVQAAAAAVDDLIDTAKSHGLAGICLTDHDTFWSMDRVREPSVKHEFLVLPGSEINTDTGHVLVFGLDEYVFGLHKPSFLLEKDSTKSGVMIAAHPHRRRFLEDPGHKPEAREEMLQRAHGDDFFQMCHAVEGFNGRATEVQNSFSHELGERLGAKMSAGSDAHRLEQVGTAATYLEEKISSLADLIKQIKLG